MRDQLVQRWLLVGVATLLIVIGLAIPSEGFWVVDCGLRYLQVLNIVDRHHWGGFWLDYPLRNSDADYRLVPFAAVQTFVHEGRLFAQYPPWFAYATAPWYAWLGKWGLRVLPLLGAVALLVGVYRLARMMVLPAPGVAAALVLFGTPVLPYVYTFWDIVPALAAGVWGLACLVESVQRASLWRASVAGLALWLAFVAREEYLLWTGCVCASAWLLAARAERKPVLLAAAVACSGMIASMIVNTQLIGVPLFFLASTGSGQSWAYSWSLSSRPFVLHHYLAAFSGMKVVTDWSACGVLLLLALLPFVPASSRRVSILALGFLAALAVRFYAWDNREPVLTQYRCHSMTSAAPLVFVGLLGWSRRVTGLGCASAKPLRIVAAASAGFLVLTLLLSVPSSAVGLNFGPRLLLPIYPGFMLVAWAFTLDCWRKRGEQSARLATVLLAGLAVLGCVDSGLYLTRLRLQVRQMARLEHFLDATAPDRPILTDRDWLASQLPGLYYRRVILPVFRSEELDAVLAAAKGLNPQGVIYVTGSQSRPRWFASFRRAEELGIEQRVRFVDSTFRVRAWRLDF